MVPDPPTASPFPGRAIHASAVVVDGRALLIVGPSRAGKSTLAAMLVAASSPANPVQLLGDDRILLSATAGGWIARPHPRIAGFIERRGLGIVAMDHVSDAPVGGIVAIGGAIAPIQTLQLSIASTVKPIERRDLVLDWWRRERLGASCGSHPGSKRAAATVSCAKD